MAYKSGYKSGFSNGYSYQGYNSGLGSYDYLKDDVVADMRDRFPDLTDSEFNALFLRNGGTTNSSPTTGNTTDGAGVNVDQIAGGPLSPPSAAIKAMYKKYLDQEANIRQYYKGVLDQMAKKDAATKAMYANYLQQMGVDLQKGQAAYGAQAERLAQSGLTNSGTADAASSAAYSGYVSNQQAVRAQQEASRQAYEENVAAINKQAIADIRANANEFDLKKAEADEIEAANKEAEETKAKQDAANAYKDFYDSVVTGGMTEDQAEKNLIGLGYSPELAAAAKQQFADTGIGATLEEEKQNTVNSALMGALSPTVNEETGETVPGASLSTAIQALKNQGASDDQLKIAADQAAGSIVTNIQGNIQSGNIWGISQNAVQEYLDSPYVSEDVKTQIRTELGNAQAQRAEIIANTQNNGGIEDVAELLASAGIDTSTLAQGEDEDDAHYEERIANALKQFALSDAAGLSEEQKVKIRQQDVKNALDDAASGRDIMEIFSKIIQKDGEGSVEWADFVKSVDIKIENKKETGPLTGSSYGAYQVLSIEYRGKTYKVLLNGPLNAPEEGLTEEQLQAAYQLIKIKQVLTYGPSKDIYGNGTSFTNPIIPNFGNKSDTVVPPSNWRSGTYQGNK